MQQLDLCIMASIRRGESFYHNTIEAGAAMQLCHFHLETTPAMHSSREDLIYQPVKPVCECHAYL
jgi:hypothetical protein